MWAAGRGGEVMEGVVGPQVRSNRQRKELGAQGLDAMKDGEPQRELKE